jgi:hypothetical protein
LHTHTHTPAHAYTLHTYILRPKRRALSVYVSCHCCCFLVWFTLFFFSPLLCVSQRLRWEGNSNCGGSSLRVFLLSSCGFNRKEKKEEEEESAAFVRVTFELRLPSRLSFCLFVLSLTLLFYCFRFFFFLSLPRCIGWFFITIAALLGLSCVFYTPLPPSALTKKAQKQSAFPQRRGESASRSSLPVRVTALECISFLLLLFCRVWLSFFFFCQSWWFDWLRSTGAGG